MQKYNSAYTSINKTRLPAIYNKLDWEKLRENWYKNHSGMPYVYDYGCGRYINHIMKFLEEKGFEYIGYDYNWNPDNKWSKKNPPAVIICSNVLNVIAEDKIVESIVKEITQYDSPFFVTVYEGNKEGKGKINGTSYQRNLRTTGYKRFWPPSKNVCIKKLVITHSNYTQYIK